MKKFGPIFIIALLLLSCGRWKTTKLKPDQMCILNSGTAPGEIMLNLDKNNTLDISFSIEIHEGDIFIMDNTLKRMQVLDSKCSPRLIIGQKESGKKGASGIKKSYFNFSIIGSTAVDSEDNIYIQNRFTSSKIVTDDAAENYNLGFSPTYILVFNSKGNLLYTLGKRGAPDIPFNYIEAMYIDANDRLFVVTRTYETWSVLIFKGKTNIFSEDFGEAEFKNDEDKISGKIENIKIFRNGSGFLLSVAYYEKSNFIHRKILNYSVEKKRIDGTIMTIPDPQNELFSIVDDRLIYLWDVKKKNVKFIVCSINGNIINNILLDLPEKRPLFTEIVIDENGELYSYNAMNNHVEVQRWR